MLQPPVSIPAVPPKPLRTARIILWIQTALVALGTIGQLLAVSDLTDHGQDVGGYNYFVIFDNVVVAVMALIAALFIVKSRPAWVLAFVVEALALLNGILNLAHGQIAGIVECAFAIGVLVLLGNRQVSEWYRPAQQHLEEI